MPLWLAVILVWSALASVIAFVLYGVDKRRAIANRAGCRARRVPERTLHLWETLGGWPGGLLARRVFHHKTDARAKARFVWTSRVIVAAHLIAWCAIGYFVLVR